jgi:hypothetical protein
MEIKRVGSQPSSRGSADYFTGAVRLEKLLRPKSGAGLARSVGVNGYTMHRARDQARIESARLQSSVSWPG